MTPSAALIAALLLHPFEQEPEHLSSGRFTIHYWGGHERAAARLLDVAGRARFPGIRSLVAEDATTDSVEIYLAPDKATFRRLSRGAPDWWIGLAYPESGTIVLPLYGAGLGGASDAGVLLRHELAHVALRRHLGRPPPRWFDEGYAQLASGSWDADQAWRLRLAIVLGKLPPLDSLSLEFPEREVEARLAYLLSYTAVYSLFALTGPEAFAALLTAWRETGQLDKAMREVLGLTLAQFERLWREEVRARYGWLAVLSQATVFWVAITVVLLGLGTWKKRRDAAKWRRLVEAEAEEAGPGMSAEDAGGIDGPAPAQ